MCGICGIITKERVRPEQAELVARLQTRLRHRGPDSEGTVRGDHFALAMRRLSVIDLGTGAQPLFNEDQSLALICNGEIYNFIELRQTLESRGHRFATKSDCETILHLYEEHGDECVHHLRGMFAFALWDSRRRRVLLARDRMGEKPLCLIERPGSVLFCSELRALVQAGAIDVELDPVAIHDYFHFGYVPEPASPIKGVRKLPAGHILTIDIDSWNVQQRCYWRMEDSPPVEGDPPALIRDELERISELIIRSDVPVGVALSGGLDSSLIAVLAQKNYPGTMHAITVGYEGSPWQDERAVARELAGHLKMPMHEVELSATDMIEAFPAMALERDEPIADPAGVGYRALMQRARAENLPVMLAGQGGDELFWGYRFMREAAAFTRRRAAIHATAGDARRPGFRNYIQLTRPPVSYIGGLEWLKSLGGIRSGLRQRREDLRAPAERMVFYDREIVFRQALDGVAALYAPQFAAAVADSDPRRTFDHSLPWPNIDVALMGMISRTFLAQLGITQCDRLSMAHNVELRLPLVDYRLVELVVGLTKTQPSVAHLAKRWLRDAVRDIVPRFVFERRKRGFSTPWRQWGGALDKAFGDQVLGGFLRQHGVLSEEGSASARRWLAPPKLTVPNMLGERALMLEVWGRGLT